ncbi:MAG TPA: PIG-L family deacetylase [Terriglobales bacterium]|nr:PIG-L family deacetylase [Terriglobales bacterium]
MSFSFGLSVHIVDSKSPGDAIRLAQAVRTIHLFSALLLFLGASFAFAKQPVIPQDSGPAGLQETLRKLHTTARLMHTTAHPDDEDGGMLTLEVRGHGATALQMTLTRGEGGQNKTGNAFGDELGILRTLEMLAADKYYGVEQRFSRVADFGFSKTADETFQKWGGHDVALDDIVRVIRTFRPDVIITRFQGAPRDGHGNHQASGILTREAFRAAADPNRFPEQIREGLQPWQAKKLYMDNVHSDDDWTIDLNTGSDDPLLGTSYIQFAMQGLRHQLSQGAGMWSVSPGPHHSYYKLIDTVLPNYHPQHEKDYFDGIDTSLPALADRLGNEQSKVPFLKLRLQELAKDVDDAAAASQQNMQAAAVPLLAGLKKTKELIQQIESSSLSAAAKDDMLTELETKRKQFADAANIALNIALTAYAELPGLKQVSDPHLQEMLTAVPGERFNIASTFSGPMNNPEIVAPRDWQVHLSGADRSGGRTITQFTVSVPANAPYTAQYFHRANVETDSIYQISDPQYVTLPLTPPPLHAHATYTWQGYTGEIEAPVEVELPEPHPLIVGPAIAISTSPVTRVMQKGSTGAEISASLFANRASKDALKVTVEAPTGWTAKSSHDVLSLNQAGQTASATVNLKPDSVPEAAYEVPLMAHRDGQTFDQGYSLVTREDLGAAYYFRNSTQRISIVDVNLPRNLTIGYIMGAGDDIPTVLQQLGLNVTLISPEELAAGDLGRYQTIVLGIRAYDTREDVRKNNQRLLQYVSDGGTLIVQYNQQFREFNSGNFTPYPTEESRERVTVEQAPVEILAPNDPIFDYPNRITPKDFDGWVQERGLYFMSSWDSKFEPLMASHDPNEDWLKGGLLRAHVGKGVYIYSAYAFFRQLPAGVPGAIRLFVNILDAGHQPAATGAPQSRETTANGN